MENTTAAAFRKRALNKVVIGVFGCLGVAGLLVALAFAGYLPDDPFALVPAAIPFVYCWIGVVELLTGRPYQQLADAWMALKGWQRGLIGTFIVLVAGFLIIVVMTAAVMLFT